MNIMNRPRISSMILKRQRGAAAVEFALIAVAFLSLLFGIIEFGRLFFNINSVQEITRRAAREQVVRWVTTGNQDVVKLKAVLCDPDNPPPGKNCTGTVYFPGAIDITNAEVRLSFYKSYDDAVDEEDPISYGSSSSPTENIINCQANDDDCIRFVRAELVNEDGTLVSFRVLAPFLPSTAFPLPGSTVIMPAESLGFRL